MRYESIVPRPLLSELEDLENELELGIKRMRLLEDRYLALQGLVLAEERRISVGSKPD